MNSRAQASPPTEYLACLRSMIGLFGPREWLIVVAAGAATVLVIGLPSALIDNPIFGRSVEARTQDYVLLAAAAPLAGLIVASFAAYTDGGNEGKATAGGLLSFIAVGCPVCNKLVVAALGTSGALTIFAPAQLLLGVASLVLLGWVLLLRARAVTGACPVPRQERGRKVAGLG